MSQSGTFSQNGGPLPPTVLETLTGDVGGPVPATLNNINILGGENINTSGNPGTSTITVNLNETIHWPDTNNTGTTGAIYLGGAGGVGGYLFMHNFTTDPLDHTNTFLGHNAAGNLTNSGQDNTGIGNNSLENIAGVIAFSSGNTAVGSSSLEFLVEADNNTAVGRTSLQQLIGGFNNTSIGVDSLTSLTDGNNTTQSCFNVALGASAGFHLVHGAFNTLLGSGDGTDLAAGFNFNGSESSNIMLGNPGSIGDNNTIRIGKQGSGNNQHNKCFIAGIFGTTVGASGTPVVVDNAGQLGTIVSSKRFKKDIQIMRDDDSAGLMYLRPVSFRMIADGPHAQKRFGLIAEEVEEQMPSLVTYDDENKPFSVKYNDLPVLLLNELQKQQHLINSLLRRINLLEQTSMGSYVDEL